MDSVPATTRVTTRAEAWRTWLGLSLVVFALSERAFWAFWRKNDEPGELFITWFAYSLVVAFCLSVARLSQVRDRHQVFLVGALMGWLAEGVAVQTVLGSGDNPFPLSISWTGLAWHSLLTVVGGAWVLPRLGSEPLNPRTFGNLVAFGIGFGLWANYYFLEKGESIHSLNSFTSHTLFLAALLIPGLWLMGEPFPAGPPTSRDIRVVWIIGMIAAGCYASVALMQLPFQASVVAACFGVTLWALLKNRNNARAVVPAPSRMSLPTAIAIGGIPLASAWVVVAVTFQAGGWSIPSNILIYGITMPLGFWFLGSAWRQAFRPLPAATSESG